MKSTTFETHRSDFHKLVTPILRKTKEREKDFPQRL